MPNRRQRRAEKARQRTSNVRINLGDVGSKFDIHVDAKIEQVVMISANSKGRGVVEDLWPDVEWTIDDKFSMLHSADWLFTHIRVTRLPPHLEATVPLVFAGGRTRLALQSRPHCIAALGRCASFTGPGKVTRCK